jgi:hypothetical protein
VGVIGRGGSGKGVLLMLTHLLPTRGPCDYHGISLYLTAFDAPVESMKHTHLYSLASLSLVPRGIHTTGL